MFYLRASDRLDQFTEPCPQGKIQPDRKIWWKGNMSVACDFIHGVAVGIEYVGAAPEVGHPSTVILDLFIIRVLIQW